MKVYFWLLSFFLLTACARPPVTGPENAVSRINWWRVDVTEDDLQFKGLADAVRKSLVYYGKLPPETPIRLGDDSITFGDVFQTLEKFLVIIDNSILTPSHKIERIKEEFELYQAVGSDGSGTVLFTGYYEPILSCRPERDDTFRYALYRRPDDIVEVDLSQFGNGWPRNKLFGRITGNQLVPYYSREEIELEKALEGKNLEILWCSDPVDIFFLQVQGSGKADLGDGTVLSVLYDAQNGWPYRSIGKYLIDDGAIDKEQMSMQAIRSYLQEHPDQIEDILNKNPSYVFFRLDSGSSIGSIGAPLTPGRSIATDSRLFPKGGLALIRTARPVIAVDGSIITWTPMTRFVLNQDTGGAIRGAGRADLFWGQGREAEIAAGFMRQEGELYFLLKKKKD